MNKKDPIKVSLDKYSSDLDQETVAQLDGIRKKVLSNNLKPRWYHNLSWPMLGPVVAAMVLVVVFVTTNQDQALDTKSDNFLSDLDLLSHEVDTDLLEDMEFIAWLDNENLLEGDLL